VQETFLNVFPAISSKHKIRAAEAAGLFTPIYRDTVRALQFELASLCVGEGVDYSEALDLCRGFGLSLAFPKTVQGRDSIGSQIALSSNYRGNGPRLIRAASRVNEGVQQQIMSMIKNALDRCGRRIRRSRIAVLGLEGLGTRPRITHESPEILQTLKRRGAILSLYPGEDSDWVAGSPISEHVRIEKSIMRAVEDTNCALVALDGSNADELNPQKLAAEMSRPAAICDLTRVLEASNVERAGLFYTSLGRGSPGA
jgi:UDP-N-acetyl-D-mannosaminuronate dehydrogenase